MRSKRILFLFIITIVLLFSCQTTPEPGYVVSSMPQLDEKVKVIAFNSSQGLPEGLPLSLTVTNSSTVLFEALSMEKNILLTDFKTEESTNVYYEDVLSSTEKKQLLFEQNIRFISAVRFLSFHKPQSSMSLGPLSSSSKTFQIEMEIVVYDLELNVEYKAVTTAVTSQRANTAGLSANLDKTTGEKSAIAVSVEKGIFELVSLIF